MGENSNIPMAPTSFIGRERERAEVARLLGSSRLVTLTGAAGCGKTRLALQVAREVDGRYAQGVHWIELAPLVEPTLLPQTIAKRLRLQEQADRPSLPTIIDALQDRQLLLILDNCEHLRTACTQLVTTLLAETTISILVTSRESLGVTGERLYPVPPLSLPPRNDTREDLAEIGQFDAIQLFVERARAVLPPFALTVANVDGVANICHQLDGIPLALEMAAARVNVLTVEQIADHLDDHFALLAPAAQVTYSPHQTLRAAIDWSYDLLTTPEQILLRRLSVFIGGCSLDEVETVCTGDGLEREQILELLASLVNKSLVRAVTLQRAEARYALLETIRQYGQEKLKEVDEWARIHDRHLQCFLQLTEETEPKLRGPYQQVWLNWLEDEYDNIRAALSWSLASHQIEAGLRITTAIYLLWAIRGYVNEGLAWLERLLVVAEESVSPIVRANTLAYAAILAFFRGDEKAQETYGREAARLAEVVGEASKPALVWALVAQAISASGAGDFQTEFTIGQRIIQLNRTLGDDYQLGVALATYSTAAMNLGKFAEARAMLEEALPLLKKTGDSHRTGMVLNFFGDLERCEQNDSQAQKYYEESIVTLRKVNAERDMASVKQNLGHAMLHLGDGERAHALFSESMATHQAQQNTAGMAECLIGFAALAISGDRAADGARLLGAAEAIGGEKLTAAWPATKMEYEHYLALAGSQLSEPAFQSALAAGRILSIEEAVIDAQDVARSAKSTRALSKQLDELTPREREVATLIAQAKSNGDIAAELVLSKRTVESHIANIRSKLGFTERAQIVRWAIDTGLADVGEQGQ